MALTKSQRERKRIEEAELQRRFRDEIQLAEKEKPACSTHDWHPERRGPEPMPPASLCPGCLSDAQALPEFETVTVPHPINRGLTPKLELRWEAYRDELERQGYPIPGSYLELQLVARIDWLREESQRKERGQFRSGYSGRPFGYAA
jgi:hypothetical protein